MEVTANSASVPIRAFEFMPHVQIEDAVFFSPNNGVGVHPEILNYDGETIKKMLATAFDYWQNPHLQDAICGECGPIAAFMGRPISFAFFLELLEEVRVKEETKKTKRKLTALRRSEFQGSRAAVMLKLIDRGVPYVCAWENCDVTEELTLDHKEPISRGGTDDLDNLQFLCKSHNSHKGDRRVAGVSA